MKVIGLVGGIGPESTVEYYRLLIARARERQLGPAPPILINSIDVAKLLALAGAGRRAELAAYLLEAILALSRGGAQLGLMAANTPHLVFAEVQQGSPIPLVSIVEATAAVAAAQRARRVGLLGTRATMTAAFYPDCFARRGMSIVVPQRDDQDYVHDKYVHELVPGLFREETRLGIVRVVERLQCEQRIDALILGGTELPLLLKDVEMPVPALDTTRIHVDAVLEAASRVD